MTVSSDSSPVLPTSSSPTLPVSPDSPSPELNPISGSMREGGRPSARNGLGFLALTLLVAGLGFVLWRVTRGGAGPGMQGPPAFPVKVERLQESSLEDSSEFVGTLDAQAGVSLQPETNGRVVQIFVTSGDRVSAGDPIMQLSSERSQADYNAALANVSASRSSRDAARAQLRAANERQNQLLADLALQEADYERTETLVAKGALAQEVLDEAQRDLTVAGAALNSAIQEIEALESSLSAAEATLNQVDAIARATQEDLLDRTVTAPIAGIVGDIPIKLGDYVTSGLELATITQNQELDLEIFVPVDEASRLRTGLPVELSLLGSGKAIATGNLRFISPTTDPDTQTVLAKARFSNPSQPIQDNQRLEVRVIWNERPGILVPTTAISDLGGQKFVFVPGEPDPPSTGEAPQGPPGQTGEPPALVAKLKPVTLGKLQGNAYQILTGLEPGDAVITSGLLNLRDGVPIQPQLESNDSASGGPESREPEADGPIGTAP